MKSKFEEVKRTFPENTTYINYYINKEETLYALIRNEFQRLKSQYYSFTKLQDNATQLDKDIKENKKNVQQN